VKVINCGKDDALALIGARDKWPAYIKVGQHESGQMQRAAFFWAAFLDVASQAAKSDAGRLWPMPDRF